MARRIQLQMLALSSYLLLIMWVPLLHSLCAFVRMVHWCCDCLLMWL